MKKILTLLLITFCFSTFGQQNQPSGVLKLIQSPAQYYRPSDSTLYNFKTSLYKWNRQLTSKDSSYFLSKINLKQDKFTGITTNYVPKWNGTTLVNGVLFDNGSVGIGNVAPGSKLDVTGQTTTTTLKVTDQAAANKMLISDSNGLLSYTNAYPGAGIPISTGTYWNTSIANNSVGWNRAVIDTLRWSGIATGLNAATARTSLGATTVGQNLFLLTNPSAITFPRINADNSVSALTGSAFLTAIGADPAAGSSTITTIGTLTSGSIPYTLLSGTVPIWNQSTTGSAATLTTPRTIAGTSFNGSANIALTNKFIAQGTTDTGITGAQFLGGLTTGVLKNTTTTGVLTIATGADLPVMSATVGGAVPTPPNNTTTFLRGDGTFAAPPGSTIDNHQQSNTIVSGIGGGSSVYTNTITYTPKGSHALFMFSGVITGTAGDNWQFSFSNETIGGFGAVISGRTQTFYQYIPYQYVLSVTPNVSIIFHVQMWAATTTSCIGDLTIIDIP